MYSGSSDKLASIARVGSHATKHSASGKGGVLPPGADPWAVIFNDIRTQRAVVVERWEKAKQDLSDLNWMLRGSSDPGDQQRILTKRKAILSLIESLEKKSGAMRAEAIVAARSSIGVMFMAEARAMLLPEHFAAILEKARELCGSEISSEATRDNTHREHKRKEDMTPEQLASQRAKDRQKEKRKKLAGRFLLSTPPLAPSGRNIVDGDRMLFHPTPPAGES